MTSPFPPYAGLESPRLDERLFRRPPAGYRGAPFWSWNCRLERAALLRQIEVFRTMGFGGFHLHARTGLATPYLGPAYLRLVRACTQRARRRGLLAWLYDEDRWPSGFGGGRVTADPRHRLKYFLFTPRPYDGTVRPAPNISCAAAGRQENGTLLARYAVRLAQGRLAAYRRLEPADCVRPGERTWHLYLEHAAGTPWFNGQTYVDTLSPAAIRRFLQVTHEPLKRAVGGHFGRTVPAFFTDEPQHAPRGVLPAPGAVDDVTLPATSDFLVTYRRAFGEDLLDSFPELVWDLPGGRASRARWRYHDHATARFAEAYAGTLARWCERNAVCLTGHMMEEPTLGSQTRAVGEAMRSLAHFHLPGVDLLCDREEYTTLKQAQSVAHQYGRAGVLSELYGVTGWDYDFVGHKAQGDWQAALGVTTRAPHLAWVSMAGEAKRDYPASIHYQSPWHREYRLVEDHFARTAVVLARGRPLVRVAVIHPIESYWLACGPAGQNAHERAAQERRFAELPQWLLGGLLDFDYVAESLLPTLPAARADGNGFTVGEMSYAAVVVPALRTLRSTTLARLEEFAARGGTVVFSGGVPALVDTQPSPRARRLARRVRRCAWSRDALVAALAPFRELDCRGSDGRRATALLHQLRADGPERHLFLCNRDRWRPQAGLSLRLPGRWRCFNRDTHDGSVRELPARHAGDATVVKLDLPAHGHALLTFRPGTPAAEEAPPPERWRTLGRLEAPVPVTLSEPNVLLLDQAEWRWDDGAWQPGEEILRIHRGLRARFGLVSDTGSMAQPWTEAPAAGRLGRVALRFCVRSDVAVAAPTLAIEEPAAWRIRWNGRTVPPRDRGWWVDEAIRRVPLPAFAAGEHTLELERDFTAQTELEWCYLLGDFGVRLRGRDARLTAPVRALPVGDWTRRGLPFYAGNVTYHFALPAPGGPVAVRFPRYASPLLRVRLDGGGGGPVAFAPFRLDLGALRRGRRRLEVTAYGNRHNAFGPLHHRDPGFPYATPDTWHSAGEKWTYGYQLKPMGLLAAPVLEGPAPGSAPLRR